MVAACAKTGKKIHRIDNLEVISNSRKTRHAIGRGLLKWDLDFINVSMNEVYMVCEVLVFRL